MILKSFFQLLFMLFLGLQYLVLNGQHSENFWTIQGSSIHWDMEKENRLPHKENIEMSGKKVSSIIYYEIDKARNISIERDIIFPQLRTYVKSNEPAWKKYRAYFRRSIGDEFLPLLKVDQTIIVPGSVTSISIEGKLIINHVAQNGLQIARKLYPSMENRQFVEQWTITNVDSIEKDIVLSSSVFSQYEEGYKGTYGIHVFVEGPSRKKLMPNQSYEIAINYAATLNDEVVEELGWENASLEREQYLKVIKENLVIKSPDAILNQLFYFSKIRAAESIFESKMGLVHSPGGGNYYVGIWANDQIEYSGPFFPFLNYPIGKEAAYNAYLWFLKNIPKDDGHIAYAFEVDGNFPMTHLDRGDAAMIAYGTSKYLLAMGDTEMKMKLWPLIEWSLAYCKNKQNNEGAIESESDEMEGRIPTGSANLSTNSLYYGGLKSSMQIAKDLNKVDNYKNYKKEKERMENVIKNYFGAEIEGLKTYKYFKENKFLRHWICLPLSMGILERKEGTLEALFSNLWTNEGVLVELNPANEQKVFWDRATLYALRGAFKAHAVDLAYEKLLAYSEKRLLGDHVPYPVEAYPENNMKHLSAESALYALVFLEGMLGLEILANKEIQLNPSFPKDWTFFNLENVNIFNENYSLYFEKKAEVWNVRIFKETSLLFQSNIKSGEGFNIQL